MLSFANCNKFISAVKKFHYKCFSFFGHTFKMLLNLCSGTGSVSMPFLAAGHTVVNVDWDDRYNPTHCVDIMTWECPYPPGHFDVI